MAEKWLQKSMRKPAFFRLQCHDRFILFPWHGGAGKKAWAFFDFCFFRQMLTTLSRSKGLQGRFVDSDFPAESRLQKIPIFKHTGFLCDGAGKSVEPCLAENPKGGGIFDPRRKKYLRNLCVFFLYMIGPKHTTFKNRIAPYPSTQGNPA